MSDSNRVARAPRPLNEYPVVLFDFDGTVADTQPAIFRVAIQIMREHGYDPDPSKMLSMIGPPLEDGFALVCGMDKDEARECADAYRELFSRTVTPDEFPLMPGMRELLDGLVASGRRVAVATSRMEASAQEMVASLGLTQFEAVIGRVHGVRYSKAESIEGALQALRVPARDAVMVGDRMHDVIGAREWEIPVHRPVFRRGVPRRARGGGRRQPAIPLRSSRSFLACRVRFGACAAGCAAWYG